MKRSIVWVAMCFLFSATLISCGPKSPFPGYTPTGTGLYYKQIEKGTGEQLKNGDVVKVNLAYYINDSLLFTTDSLPEQAYDMVRESAFQGDLYEGFRMMHVGDVMSFMINADSVYRKQFHAPIIPGFKVEEAMTEEAYQQMKQAELAALQQKAQDDFNAYLTANGIDAQPLESGLVYVCTQKGRGPKPTANQNVKVHYTGKLLDGTVFDSSVERGEPIEFPLGVGRVIPGWDEGIGLMSKGEKGILYIPFNLAYGAREAGPIPAFSNLIFEVELVDFK